MAVIVPLYQHIKALAEKGAGKPPSHEDGFPASFFDKETREWVFSEYLDQQQASFFEQFMLEHSQLTLQYNALRDEIGETISKKRQKKLNNKMLVEQVIVALATSALLEHIHQRRYLDTWQVVSDLQEEQAAYRRWLGLQGYKFSDQQPKQALNKDDFWLRSKQAQLFHDASNPFRLLVIRIRRMFILMALVLQDAEHYGRWLNAVEQFTGPFFTYLAWIFFFPRLLANLAVMGKHVFFPDETGEGALSWQTRLSAQLSRRGSELANDVAWFASGIVACFILVGPLMPVAIYLAIAMQCYDLVSSILRALHAVPRLRELENKYTNMRQKASDIGKKDEVKSIDRYLLHLRKRMSRDEKLLYLGIANFAGLCIAITLSLPLLAAISPVIPLVGAVLAILISIFTYFARESLRASIQPNRLNEKLLETPDAPARRHGLFDNKPKEREDKKPENGLERKKKRNYKSLPELQNNGADDPMVYGI